jgi:hypothetical protein
MYYTEDDHIYLHLVNSIVGLGQPPLAVGTHVRENLEEGGWDGQRLYDIHLRVKLSFYYALNWVTSGQILHSAENQTNLRLEVNNQGSNHLPPAHITNIDGNLLRGFLDRMLPWLRNYSPINHQKSGIIHANGTYFWVLFSWDRTIHGVEQLVTTVQVHNAAAIEELDQQDILNRFQQVLNFQRYQRIWSCLTSCETKSFFSLLLFLKCQSSLLWLF